MTYETEKKFLAIIVKKIALKHKDKLEELKLEYKNIKRPDFIWHYLLQSFATMGRAAGWHGLIGNKENYAKLNFENLSHLSDQDREILIHTTCRDAKIRMPSKKAEYIISCFNYIQSLGGLAATNSKLFNTDSKTEKINFLKSFHGIGPKYARNIMMDVYHEDFRESIAIDIRIKNISNFLGIEFQDYSQHEKFYLDVAHSAQINGWELDRLLFNFNDEIMQNLKKHQESLLPKTQ